MDYCELHATGSDFSNANNMVSLRFQTQIDPFSSQNQTVLKLSSLHGGKHSGTTLVWSHANKVTIDDLKIQIRKLCGFPLTDVGIVDDYGRYSPFANNSNLLMTIKGVLFNLNNQIDVASDSNNGNSNNHNNNSNSGINNNHDGMNDISSSRIDEIKNNNENDYDGNTYNEYNSETTENFDTLFNDPITNVFRVTHSRTVSKQMENKLDILSKFGINDSLRRDSDNENGNNNSNNNNSYEENDSDSDKNSFANGNVSGNEDEYDNGIDVNDDNWNHLHSDDELKDESIEDMIGINNGNSNNNVSGGTINRLKIRTSQTDASLKKLKVRKYNKGLMSPAVEQDIARHSFNAQLTDEMADEIAIEKFATQMRKERDGDDGTIVSSTPLVHSKLIDNFDQLNDNWSDFDQDDS